MLPRDFARPGLGQPGLGELMDLIRSLALAGNGNGHDLLGRVCAPEAP